MEDETANPSDMKKPIGRAYNVHQDEHGEKNILPPANTRVSRRTKKLSEMSSGDPGQAATEGYGNEDQENVSTANTPSSSASSSRYTFISSLLFFLNWFIKMADKLN